MTKVLKSVSAAALVAALAMPAVAQDVPLNSTITGGTGLVTTDGQATVAAAAAGGGAAGGAGLGLGGGLFGGGIAAGVGLGVAAITVVTTVVNNDDDAASTSTP